MPVNKEIVTFCDLIRSRSDENKRAINILSICGNTPIGPSFSILRQELDSMVRVMYLLNMKSLDERRKMISQTLNGEQWTIKTEKGKERKVTDKEMVDIANDLNGWALYVYKFGCSFIHLSNFHNYLSENPVLMLSDSEKEDIISYMKNYHEYHPDTLEIQEVCRYLPQIFDKISSNLDYYIDCLLKNSRSSLSSL